MKIKPSEIVINAFGGVRATARLLRRSPGAVSLWKQPRSRKGCDGNIPRKLIHKILVLSDKKNKGITIRDLIYGRNND